MDAELRRLEQEIAVLPGGPDAIGCRVLPVNVPFLDEERHLVVITPREA